MTLKNSTLAICTLLFCTLGVISAQDGPEKEPAVDYTPFKWRVWTNSNGAPALYGQFDKIVDRNIVVIYNREGKQVSVPIHKLSDKDIFEAVMSDRNVESVAGVSELEMEVGIDSLEIDSLEESVDVELIEEKSVEFADLEEFDLDSGNEKKINESNEQKNGANNKENEASPTATRKSEGEKLAPGNEKPVPRDEDVQKQRDLLSQWDKVRTWTDVSGQHTRKGKFVKVIDRACVILLNEDDKEIAIPLSKLSVDDIHVAVHGELCRPDGTRLSGIAISSDWVPGKNKN